MEQIDYDLRMNRVKQLLQKALGKLAAINMVGDRDMIFSDMISCFDEAKILTQQLCDHEIEKTKQALKDLREEPQY